MESGAGSQGFAARNPRGCVVSLWLLWALPVALVLAFGLAGWLLLQEGHYEDTEDEWDWSHLESR